MRATGRHDLASWEDATTGKRCSPDGSKTGGGAWLELRADDPAAVLRAALDAGLTQVKHPSHPYYFMIPGGQVFTIAQTS